MDKERFKNILSVLHQCELTSREKQFLEAVRKYFYEKGAVTDQQGSILEGLYREKKWISKAFLNQNSPSKRSSSNGRTAMR